MKRRTLTWLVPLLGLGAACTHASAPVCPTPILPADRAQVSSAEVDDAASAAAELEAKLAQANALAERARKLFDVPGLSVGLVIGDELVMAKGYGVKELGKEDPVDGDTSYAIASNTKAFTATAVGILVADGRLGWDDRVKDHIPDLELWHPYVTQELRVRDLLSHRVGLATWAGDLMWISSKLDRATVMSRLKHLPAASGLRERYGYSNLMFMLAGELIRIKSGQVWDQFIQTRILDPLKMSGVSTRVGQLNSRENVATAHIQVEGKWESTPYLDLATVGPAASFHASVTDLGQWVRMQINEGKFEGQQIVPKAVLRETRQPHIWLSVGEEDFYEPRRNLSGYGLGWYLADYRSELMVWHGGGMPGMTSRVLMFPESKIGVVVLTSSESGVSGALALQIADLFLAEEGEKTKDYLAAMHEMTKGSDAPGPVAPPLEGEPPAGLEGRWSNPILGKAHIKKEADGTWFEVPEHGGLRCRFYAPVVELDPVSVPCKWTDPNMGVSQFRLTKKGKKIRSLAFRVRPDFYDPLEYTFKR